MRLLGSILTRRYSLKQLGDAPCQPACNSRLLADAGALARQPAGMKTNKRSSSERPGGAASPKVQRRRLAERETTDLFVATETLQCAHRGCVPCIYKLVIQWDKAQGVALRCARKRRTHMATDCDPLPYACTMPPWSHTPLPRELIPMAWNQTKRASRALPSIRPAKIRSRCWSVQP